jgi:urease accessory protein
VLLVRTILGTSNEARFVGRRVERLGLTSADASKRRFRSRTEFGTDVAVDLARGSYLEDGAVLFDDGERIVVVERQPEDALIIRLSSALEYAELVRQAALLGHAFGNQHVPLELVEGEIRIPITTSREIAAATVQGIHLGGAEISFGLVPFGRTRPLTATMHDHHPQGAEELRTHDHG